MVESGNGEVSVGLIRSRLPGLTKETEERWPDPLKWDQVGASDVIQWLLAIQETGKLSKTQLGVKRAAVRNLFKDYQAGNQFERISTELSELSTGLNRKIATSMQQGQIKVREGKQPLPS